MREGRGRSSGKPVVETFRCRPKDSGPTVVACPPRPGPRSPGTGRRRLHRRCQGVVTRSAGGRSPHRRPPVVDPGDRSGRCGLCRRTWRTVDAATSPDFARRARWRARLRRSRSSVAAQSRSHPAVRALPSTITSRTARTNPAVLTSGHNMSHLVATATVPVRNGSAGCSERSPGARRVASGTGPTRPCLTCRARPLTGGNARTVEG